MGLNVGVCVVLKPLGGFTGGIYCTGGTGLLVTGVGLSLLIVIAGTFGCFVVEIVGFLGYTGS